MEEIYIIYWSQTGNTQTMVEAIGKGVEKAGKTAQVLSVEDALRLDARRWGQRFWKKRRWNHLFRK